MPAEIVAVANHKGGVGKSFTAVSLASGMERALDVDSFASYQEFFAEETIAVAHDELQFAPRSNLYACGFIRGDFGPRILPTLPYGNRRNVACITFGFAISEDITTIVRAVSKRMTSVLLL
jgi:hypothetical protein